jgi:hypothetical protein
LPDVRTPESRAVAFLSREVPLWSPEKKCFSCHNNGDGARALFTASAAGFNVAPQAVADTSRWLLLPNQWDQRAERLAEHEKTLARIQFASGLFAGHRAGRVKGDEALRRAAALVAKVQQPDGSWKVDTEGSVGSPVTYGPVLATVQAREVLHGADPIVHRDAIRRAETWLLGKRPRNLPDAAAVVMAFAGRKEATADVAVQRSLELIRTAEAPGGGWGPFATTPPEPFDTALVVLALRSLPRSAATEAALARGRAYLVGTQLADGSWPETTRPAGSESYAQRLSTTGWATLALLATRPGGPR